MREFKNKMKVYSDSKRISLVWRKILNGALGLVILFLLIIAVLSGIRKGKENQWIHRFEASLRKQEFEQALTVYHQVQGLATDPEVKPEKRKPFQKIQLSMENQVSDLLGEIVQQAQIGEPLSDQQQKCVIGLKELSVSSLAPLFQTWTEELLDGKIQLVDWDRFLSAFEGLSSVQMTVNYFLEQKESLESQIPAFREAEEMESGEDWLEAWEAWQHLIEAEDGCRLSRDYAQLHLKIYQEREYKRLLNQADRMIEKGQYQSVTELLRKMAPVFPDREAITDRLNLYEPSYISKVGRWYGQIDVLAIRPIAVRPELSFERSESPDYAQKTLLSCAEWKRILQSLYDSDYCLVSPELFVQWPKRRAVIEIPSGKKPLMLVFDAWQYSVLNQVCGTINHLSLEDSGELTGVVGEQKGRDLDALLILEDFLKLHPDFSFNGAKGLIALNTEESLFGYVVNETQEEAIQKAWKRVGQLYPNLTEEEWSQQSAGAAQVIDQLAKKGWLFACAGNQGLDTGTLSLDDLKEEVSKWSKAISPFLSEASPYFAFPNGSHVYNSPEALNYLLESGFHVFLGEGPNPYYFYGDTYAHVDRTPVNANSLKTPAWNLDRILNSADILKGR